MDIKELVKGARKAPANTQIVTGDVVGGSLPPAPEPPQEEKKEDEQQGS